MLKKIFLLLLIFSFALPALAQAAPIYSPGMVSINFDDGLVSTLGLAAPAMAAYGYSGTAYVNPQSVNDREREPEYYSEFMSWAELASLQSDFGWEIGSHSYSHDDLTLMPLRQAKQDILKAKAELALHGLNAESFATPYGAHSEGIVNFVRKLFNSHRTAWNLPNDWPVNDYYLKAKAVLPGTPVAEVAAWIDEAKANGQWLILYFHALTEGAPLPENDDYSLADFNAILFHLSSSRLPVVTTSQGVDSWGSGPNLVPNGSFEAGSGRNADGWIRSNSNQVKILGSSQGAYPAPQRSARIVGNMSAVRSISTYGINLDDSRHYRLKAFYRLFNYVSGDVSVWISQFDENYNYLGGQWLGGFNQNFVGTRFFDYSPSPGTAMIEIYFLSHPGANLKLDLDGVDLRSLN